MPIPTISIRYVIRLLELAARDGAPAAELLARAGLPPIEDDLPDVRVPTEHYYRLWGVTMATLRDPTFPLRLPDRMDTASFDALGYAVVTSATLGDAFGRIQRYLRFVTDGASWAFEHAGDSAVVTFTQHGTPAPEHQYVDEFSLAHLVSVGRKLTATPWEVDEVRFRHPAPADVSAMAATTGHRLHEAPRDLHHRRNLRRLRRHRSSHPDRRRRGPADRRRRRARRGPRRRPPLRTVRADRPPGGHARAADRAAPWLRCVGRASGHLFQHPHRGAGQRHPRGDAGWPGRWHRPPVLERDRCVLQLLQQSGR
ncbi:MAG: AraC family transcriptional regulator [Deltaproteobacteria bacterium]|nr:AraC family transcriptional regulator [Deltaproteobacteria bacterium]